MFIDLREREEGAGRERKKKTNQLVVSHIRPNWGLNLQPRHVP